MFTIKTLSEKDINLIVTSFSKIGWNKPSSIFYDYLKEQESNQRKIWLAFNQEIFLGYVTLKWHSDYPSFLKLGIPEIKDLNVLPEFRNQGVGSKLLDIAEDAAKHKGIVGLGVGLFRDYGAAQKLYVKRGYIPDGMGLTYNYEYPKYGAEVIVNDDLLLWLIKKLK